jgi:RNA polymerase sigma-70 factor (ECF subfamily)
VAERSVAEEPVRPPDPEEEALVRGLVAGETAAVSEFVQRTHGPVFAMACRLTSDPDLRQDWTHDVILRIVEELGRGRFVYRWPGCFWSWFRQRTHFLLLNQLTRQRKRDSREVGGDVMVAALDSLAGSGGGDPVADLERVEARAAVERCLARVSPESHEMALRLRLFDELSYERIAAEMEAPLNTVRSWIRRARIAMRECLARSLGE